MIHWPSSAKDGQLKVRETAVTIEPRMLVVLDCSASSYVDGEAFEDAVRVAASPRRRRRRQVQRDGLPHDVRQ